MKLPAGQEETGIEIHAGGNFIPGLRRELHQLVDTCVYRKSHRW